MDSPLRLDWKGDAKLPATARVVSSEVEWLRVAANLCAPDAQEVVVRGASLCEWALQWWRAAGGRCEEVKNAVDALLTLAPDLTREEAQAVVEKLGENWSGKGQSQWQIGEVLRAIFPDFGEDGFGWQRQLSPNNQWEFAANWLLWIHEKTVLEPVEIKLINHQVNIWREHDKATLYLFPPQSHFAEFVLPKWLGLETLDSWGGFRNLPPFPLPLPAFWRNRAREFYAQQFTKLSSECEFYPEGDPSPEEIASYFLGWWHDFERSNASLELRTIAAQTMFEVLQHHPRSISSGLVALLEPFLSAAEVSVLRALKPPAQVLRLPRALPSQAQLIFDWATQSYLPYRAWQCETNDVAAEKIALVWAQEFGKWFLDFYSLAMSGAARRFLQISHAAKLRSENAGEVTFWVITDGLGWLDARELSRFISDISSRLTLVEQVPCFATIPTITSFAKPALRWSTTPEAARDHGEAASRVEIEVPGHREAADALRRANSGDLIIWKPLEPDKTYHENADANILRGRVAGALKGLAQNIVEAALSAPATTKLQIVVTTDHGRLLGSSSRIHSIPAGFSAHGRAAYGDSRPDLSENPNLFWLDADVYRCGAQVVIPLDEGSFLTNAGEGARGRSGIEKFPHGGVFPEEVVVPWLVFERDAAPIQIGATLRGKGRAGKRCPATLELVNSSNRALALERVEFFDSNLEITLVEQTISPFQTTAVEVEFESWPSSSELKNAQASVLLRTLDGRLVEAAAQMEIETEELQTRDDDLLEGMLL